MSIYELLTRFAGLPVVDFGDPARQDTAGGDPGAVAWRVSAEDDGGDYDKRESSAVFIGVFDQFLASPAAAGTTALVIGEWGQQRAPTWPRWTPSARPRPGCRRCGTCSSAT